MNVPRVLEISGKFRQHHGPRYSGAGLTIQFHYNQTPGIHFKVQVDDEFREYILKGLKDGMASRFPDFPSTGSIWITGIDDNGIDSSQNAFYKAARMAIEQAFAISTIPSQT
jgi:hypothetical protein